MTQAAVARPRRRSSGWSEDWRRRALWIGVGLTAAMVAAVWEHSEVVSLGYEVSQLQKTRDVEWQRHRALTLESASLSSLERIDRLASQQLGLTPAKPGQVQLLTERPGVDPATRLAEIKAANQWTQAQARR